MEQPMTNNVENIWRSLDDAKNFADAIRKDRTLTIVSSQGSWTFEKQELGGFDQNIDQVIQRTIRQLEDELKRLQALR